MVDANIIGILVADHEGRVIEANDTFLRTVGYDCENLISGRVSRKALTPPEWRERDMRTVAKLNSTGNVQPFEKDYFRSRAPVLVGGARFKEGGNEADVAFVLDLTERKRAEEAVRESEQSLRSVVNGIPGLVASLTPNGESIGTSRRAGA